MSKSDNKTVGSSMSLSTAIRLGAMLGPQLVAVYGDLLRGTCGWGAAMVAVGYDVNTAPVTDTLAAFTGRYGWRPVADALRAARCHICETTPQQRSERGRVCIDAIMHLNDDHRLTREAIADYVEQIEQSLSHQEEEVL